jgi:hypothetical protein
MAITMAAALSVSGCETSNPTPVSAQNPAEAIAEVRHADGGVITSTPGPSIRARRRMRLFDGAGVATGPDQRVLLGITKGGVDAVIEIEPNSEIHLTETHNSRETEQVGIVIDLQSGSVACSVSNLANRVNFTIQTTNFTCGLRRDSSLFVEQNPQGNVRKVDCIKGQLYCVNKNTEPGPLNDYQPDTEIEYNWSPRGDAPLTAITPESRMEIKACPLSDDLRWLEKEKKEKKRRKDDDTQ